MQAHEPEVALFGIMAVVIIIGLLVMAFWVWMLIDTLMNEPSEGNEKIVWVLVIVFLGWLGALIYLLARRPTRIRQYGK